MASIKISFNFKPIPVIIYGCIYFWALACLTESLIPLGLYVAIPCAFVLSFLIGANCIRDNRYIRLTIIFYLWIAFTAVGAYYTDVVPAYFRRLGGVLMMCIAMANLATSRKDFVRLYFAYVLVLLSALVYAKTHIFNAGFMIGQDRLDDDRLNANILATYNTYATIALYFLGNIVNSKLYKRIYRLLFIGCVPLTFILAILTGSRQVLLIQIPLISLLLYLRYIKGSSITRKFIFFIFVLVAGAYFSGSIIESYDNSLLKKRNETEIEDDGRYYLMMYAFEVGNQHMLMGVGPNNYHKFTINGGFSHCSYAEAYANHGLPGLLIFVYILLKCCIVQLIRFRKTKDKEYLVFFVFSVIFIGYNFLYVFYFDIWLWAFFILVSTHSDYIYNLGRSSCRQRIIKGK